MISLADYYDLTQFFYNLGVVYFLSHPVYATKHTFIEQLIEAMFTVLLNKH